MHVKKGSKLTFLHFLQSHKKIIREAPELGHCIICWAFRFAQINCYSLSRVILKPWQQSCVIWWDCIVPSFPPLTRLTFCLGIRYTNIYFHFINVDKSKSESRAEKRRPGFLCFRSWNVFEWIYFWTAKLISPYDWILSPSIDRDCHHRHLSRARSTKTNIFKRAHPSKVNKIFYTKLSLNKFFMLRIFRSFFRNELRKASLAGTWRESAIAERNEL